MEKPTQQSEVGLDVLVMLPCPFCGKEAIETPQLLPYGIAVCCSNCFECGMRGPYRQTAEQAIKAWNCREI